MLREKSKQKPSPLLRTSEERRKERILRVAEPAMPPLDDTIKVGLAQLDAWSLLNSESPFVSFRPCLERNVQRARIEWDGQVMRNRELGEQFVRGRFACDLLVEVDALEIVLRIDEVERSDSRW